MNDGGSVILNGSVASVKGTAAFGVYGATKVFLASDDSSFVTGIELFVDGGGGQISSEPPY